MDLPQIQSDREWEQASVAVLNLREFRRGIFFIVTAKHDRSQVAAVGKHGTL